MNRRGQESTSNTQHRTSNIQLWMVVVMAMAACGAMAGEASVRSTGTSPVGAEASPVGAAERAGPAGAGFCLKPMVAVRERGWQAGLSLSWTWGGGAGRATEDRRKTEPPTHDAAGRTAYVERAVPLWTPGFGEMVADAGAGIADVNAAVVGRDEAPQVPAEWPMWRRAAAHAGRHFEYRKGEYAAGGAVGLLTTAIAIAREESRDDGGPGPQPAAKDAALVVAGSGNTVNLTDESGAASGQIYVSGQNNTLNVTRLPPEED